MHSADEFDDLNDDDLLSAAVNCENGDDDIDDGDDAFATSPRPNKRRRISQDVPSARLTSAAAKPATDGQAHRSVTAVHSYARNGPKGEALSGLGRVVHTAKAVADGNGDNGLDRNRFNTRNLAKSTSGNGNKSTIGNGTNGCNGSFESGLALDDVSAGICQLESDDFIYISSQPPTSQIRSQSDRNQSNSLRQTTLFGQGAVQRLPSQNARRQNWPPVRKDEPPTHHELDDEATGTWVYPINLGSIRDYQFNIVSRGLYHNLLVALPTGLGKTFIAATIMLNWFRWTKSAQIVFVAPSKPLVSQQIEACFGIAGIPRSYTSMLTGDISPGLRAEEWRSKRVFFMTPQTIVNDLKTGICDPKRIVLLVVDEAHRATGNYSYVEVVKFVRRFNESFRVLALTATPGSNVEQVQEVINGLSIARIEIRTENSLDIRDFVHKRKNETILFDTTEEMELIMELFSNALRPVLAKLTAQNAYWSRDPMSLTPFGLTKARQKWMLSDAGRKANMGLKAMMHGIFTILASLAHSITLLRNHGIGPFYHTIVGFRDSISEGGNGSKYRKQINEDENFNKMMNLVRSWISNPDFIGHPKLDYLQKYILNHFLDAGEGRNANGASSSATSTKVMVFAHFRDSAEEIVRVLNRNQPMVKAHVFVGQANAKGSAGMDQKQQLEVIKKFRRGEYNTLVATSIGEEGLDIGEIDLIICYDSSASPIRMLQRMGRTGRKRAGNVLLLLMRGKEERDSLQASDNYEKMQEMIASGTKFTFCEDRSRRILPRTANPVVDKRIVEIPIENTQTTELPVPKRRGSGKAPKRPPKKFHMPDGVNTGFVSASRLEEGPAGQGKPAGRRKSKAKRPLEEEEEEEDADVVVEEQEEEEPLPSLKDVLLGPKEQRYLSRNYQFVSGYDGETYEVSPVRLDRYPVRQRTLDRTSHVAHSTVSVSLANLHTVDASRTELWRSIADQNANLIESFTSATSSEPPLPRSGEEANQSNKQNNKSSKNNNKNNNIPNRKTTTKTRSSPPPPQISPPQYTYTRRTKPHHTNTHAQSKTYPPSPFSASASSAPPSSPPPTAPEMRLPSQGISLGSSSSPPPVGDTDAAAGAEEEEEEVDTSMADFVVDDEAPLGVATSDGLPPESSLPGLGDVLTSGDGGAGAGAGVAFGYGDGRDGDDGAGTVDDSKGSEDGKTAHDHDHDHDDTDDSDDDSDDDDDDDIPNAHALINTIRNNKNNNNNTNNPSNKTKSNHKKRKLDIRKDIKDVKDVKDVNAVGSDRKILGNGGGGGRRRKVINDSSDC